jgi:hypothetical protein
MTKEKSTRAIGYDFIGPESSPMAFEEMTRKIARHCLRASRAARSKIAHGALE